MNKILILSLSTLLSMINVPKFQCFKTQNVSDYKIEISDISSDETTPRSIVMSSSSYNMVNYNVSSGITSFELFNENSYAKRNGTRTINENISLESNEQLISTNIQYNEEKGIMFTNGYNPSSENSLNANTRGTIGIIGEDERIRVTNPKAFPYYTTGLIEAIWYGLKGTDGVTYTHTESGTGSLQGPNLLLTAAHVIYADVTSEGVLDDNIINYTFPDEVHYYPGLNGDNDISNCYDITASIISIQKEYYENPDKDYDWAAVTLSSNIGNITGWNGKIGNWYEKDHAVYSFGYPEDKDGEMWLSTGTISGKTDYFYKTTLDIIPGQSGSPLFVDTNSGTYVTGVITHTNWYWLFGNQTNYNGATKINSFIFHYLNSFVTEHNWPTC
ncbi:MAG: trypsin-like serine protease [Erysipelotrichaceae bacterium]|nr:trypsin-like serine protease [Erysipelotrichaceae bacterium]